MMKKLMLIDGNAILHKAFHAMPPFKTREGELVNAVYGFSSMILGLLNQQQPDYIVATFDVKGGTFRHVEYAEYKAGRAKAPEGLHEQLPRIKEVLGAFRIPIYEKQGFEADDLLGTLTRQAEKEGDVMTYIVTGDLDTLQLVGDRVRVLAMHQGFSRPIIFDRAAVYERYGLWPEQIVDMKALQGDNSDNIKGVPGIGKKTACELLQKYEHLEGIYEHLEELKGAVLRKMTEGKEDAYLSRMLATIVCDVEGIELDLEESVVHDYDEETLVRIFEELEFRTLLGKLGRFNKDSAVRRREGDVAQQSLF